ncbi:MAG: DoxX family protein [Chloroflexia bacterium]|nr:DoxX family protein [Chloroflexia bacterium]
MQASKSYRTDNALWPWGLALIRVVVGLAFFMHGYQKLFQQGVDGVGGFFGSLGVPAPGFFALVVSLLETFGGLALIVGLLTRVVGVLLAVDMLVALLLVHRPNGFFVGDGGIELVLVLGAAALALALTGPGPLSLDHPLGIERRFAGHDRDHDRPGLTGSRG